MIAFWGGIKEEGWPTRGPARDANATKGLATSTEGEFSESSFAVLSKEYMVLSLRMGYHLSTVEAMCSEEPEKNYIRFQCKGGGASIERRTRRIGVFDELLSSMGFVCSRKGDFIDARISYQTRGAVAHNLNLLGRITVLTKQLDMALSQRMHDRPERPPLMSTVQTILSVDDEPHMLKLMERFIAEKTPYRITTTSNSLEVPELLWENTYDLILTDMRMPGLSGMDILRMVKDQDRFEEVIVVTAFGSLENAVESLSLGAFDYVTKPFRKRQLVFTIDRVMRWQKMKKDAAQLDKVFGIEPLADARKAIESEYVRRLVHRCGGDETAAAERSGLTLDQARTLARYEENGEALAE
jgi:DNA-binding response OmpR family regulator